MYHMKIFKRLYCKTEREDNFKPTMGMTVCIRVGVIMVLEY